jgi:hypothetical protein
MSLITLIFLFSLFFIHNLSKNNPIHQLQSQDYDHKLKSTHLIPNCHEITFVASRLSAFDASKFNQTNFIDESTIQNDSNIAAINSINTNSDNHPKIDNQHDTVTIHKLDDSSTKNKSQKHKQKQKKKQNAKKKKFKIINFKQQFKQLKNTQTPSKSAKSSYNSPDAELRTETKHDINNHHHDSNPISHTQLISPPNYDIIQSQSDHRQYRHLTLVNQLEVMMMIVNVVLCFSS